MYRTRNHHTHGHTHVNKLKKFNRFTYLVR